MSFKATHERTLIAANKTTVTTSFWKTFLSALWTTKQKTYF